MEVDERLRWLESRISSSLRPRGDELRSFFADEENRAAFLAFCNHSESRRIFVHLTTGDDCQIKVCSTPPRSLSDKSLFFLKCSHAAKLSRESIGNDVVYSECSKIPLNHLELVMKEVYLPLMSLQSVTQQKLSNDKLLDLMHRLVSAMQVTRGYSQGQVVLPMPSIEVLAEAAMNSDRRAAVIHVLESSVVSWMKQVKMALHLDFNSAIIKTCGKYAGPLAEVEVWNKRLSTLESVREQMDSVVVLNILHNLEQAHSTYSQAFIHVHRDIGKAIVDTEHCLVYLTILQPWFLQLSQAYSPDTLLKLFPPIMTTLSLVWQYSGIYSSGQHFQRLLHLLSNEVMLKAKDIVGVEIMEQPEISLVNLKLALRVCAAFRGCYLDYRERSEVISLKHKERVENMGLHGDTSDDQPNTQWNGAPIGLASTGVLCSWPARNSTVFATLSSFMERCNDLLELVQTVHDFRELEAAAYATREANCDGYSGDPLIADIYADFTSCLCGFQKGAKDLLSLDPDSHFEENFFKFRSTVKSLEQQLVTSLVSAFDNAPTLPAQLRVLEMFQGVSRRETIKGNLRDQLDHILTNMTSDVSAVSETLSKDISSPPLLPHTPPVACKLVWLNALKERVKGPMEKVREIGPELLEGDSGWRLRQAFNAVIDNIDSCISTTVADWCQSVPAGLQKSLKNNVLTRDSDERLIVNFDPELNQVLSEIRYLKRSPLNIRLPSSLSQLVREVDCSQLRHRQTSLQVVVQTYNEIREGLSEVEKNLFLHKLQQTEQLLCIGLDQLDWTSVAFPDFIAKTRAVVCVDLQSTLNEVHHHMISIQSCVESWSKIRGLDVFSAERGGAKIGLKQLEDKNRQVLESLHSSIPPSVSRISQLIHKTFQCIHEASQESPAWTAYLKYIDSLILSGLKDMVLTAISSLIQRATHYEQGDPIPPLVTVELELQASDVQFSPPLSVHSALVSVPEAVQKWIGGYMDLAKMVPMFEGCSNKGESRTCYEAVCSDVEIKGAVSKISAHLETNARQCQSLRKRFTMYSFLWEQDVSATFSDFLRGQAAPHPRRFTRPETVRSRASARAHSGRPKSSSQSQHNLPTTPEANLLGVMGVSDWDFLKPPSMESGNEEDESRRPSLDDFDGEIAVFQGVLERLSKVDDVSNVGWVCVDQRPAKQTLSSLVSKWKHVYASHLERQVGYVLSCLDQFFVEIEPEVERISGEESDTQAFMKLMNIFNKVNRQQVEMDTKFGAVHRAVLMLDKFEYQLSPVIRNQFNSAPQRWSNLKKRIALGKQRIGPRIQAKGDIISEDLTRFGEIFANLKSDFLSSQCIDHGCPKDYAEGLIGQFSKELKGLQTQAQDLIELQELLETSVFNFSLLKEFEEELATLQELWKLSDSVCELHSTWHRQCWSEVDSTDLLTHAEDELDLLSALPQMIVQTWDLYLYLHKTILTVQDIAPILENLKSPSMRPRHWKQVLRHAKSGTAHLLSRGGTFDVNLLEELTFGQMLDMELHDHASEIHAIVDRANKDIAIESLLNTFEEVWLSKHFELRFHKRVADTAGQEAISDLAMEASSTTPKSRAPSTRVTSGVRRGPSRAGAGGHASVTLPATPAHVQGKIPLLCNTGGIFETLESHQTSLQSLEGTIAAASFSDELQKWHKQLQTIEAVLRVWLKVQLLWVQLEEVYISSEVQEHLPSHSYTFSTVDKEWKELMATTARNTAVIAVCLKDGLLLTFEKLHTSLLQCQTALVKYVERQRSKCPWFYFLPLEDILQFLCYSSSLDQFSAHIYKLIPHAGGLVFNDALGTMSTDHTPSHAYPITVGAQRSKITGIVSSTGERLDLIQAVPCEGPVDLIISKLMISLSSTLQTQLTNVVTKYITSTSSPAHKQTKFETLANLPTIWKSNASAQIVVLATQIALELALSKAVKNTSNEKDVLNEFLSEVYSLLKTISGLLNGTILVSVSNPKLPEALASVPSESQVNLESNVALKASVSNIYAEESALSSGLLGEVEHPRRHSVPGHQLDMLRSLQLVLSNYKIKAQQLLKVESTATLSESFEWQSMLHYEWLPREHKCCISSLGTRLDYGYQFTGSSSKIMITPLLERTMYSLMQSTSNGGGALLMGKECVGRSALVNELAVSSGRLLFTMTCSPQTNDLATLDSIKGMATTGSWLFLHSLDALCPSTLQTTCSLLSKVQEARQTHSSKICWMSETITLQTETRGACFATLSSPKCEVVPPSLLEFFQTCSVSLPDRKIALESFFLTHEFSTSSLLAKLLDRVCLAVDELYSDHLPGSKDSSKSSSISRLSLHQLKAIVSLAHRHLREFENLGLLSTEDGSVVNEALKMPSMVYSEVSQSTRASLKFKTFTVDSVSNSSQPTHQIHSLEEFALVLSLKDTLLSALHPSTKEHAILVTLLSELFSSCDLNGLLAHEAGVREGLAVKALSMAGAEESARESRAASAMQTLLDENQISEVGVTIEEQIIQSCQLQQLIPTVHFQTAVSQLVTLVQLNRFVVLYGPSCSGKTSIIQVAADTLSHIPSALTKSGVVSCTTLTVEALKEEQLLGIRNESDGTWREGLLARCLSSQNGSAKAASNWFVLDGCPTPSQLDVLVSCETGSGSKLVLSSGRSLPVDQSVRFILEVPSLFFLTPSSAVRVAKLNVSAGTITWTDIIMRWFNTQSDNTSIKLDRGTLQGYFDKYVPATMEFIGPALLSQSLSCSDVGVSSTTVGGRLGPGSLQPQELKLSEVHVMQSCCRILQCLLQGHQSTTETSNNHIERSLIYAMVWSFGSFLNTTNKAIFDQWWRASFNRTNQGLCFPDDGLVWDYYVQPDSPQFRLWSNDSSHFSLPADSSIAPFVPTVHSRSVHHLINLLIEGDCPVLLNGGGGTGKTSLFLNFLNEHCKPNVSNTALLHLFVNHSTSAESVWDQVRDCLEWRWGRRYTPKGSKKLLCFVDDIHNTESNSASEFVRQQLSSGSFLDPCSGKCHNVSDMNYIVSTDFSQAQCDCSDGRFLKHFNVVHWDGYSSEDIATIFGSQLKAKINELSLIDRDTIHNLVQTSVQVHRKVGSMFLATPDRSHYIFTLRNIATIFRHLCSNIDSSTVTNSLDLLVQWQRASWWVYSGLMSSEVDRERYWEVVCHSLRKYFNQDSKLPQLLSESSSQLTESVVEQTRHRLSHLLEEYNTTHPSLHINLYDSTIEEVTQLSQVISSPHDLGQTLLLGHTHPEPLVQLAALQTGHTFTQPSQHFSTALISNSSQYGMSPHSYRVENLKKDLVHTYAIAGIKNEKIVLLLSDQELLHESFLTCVYQFVKGGAISPLFSKEDRSRIVTAVRSDLAQTGLAFSKETAWNFFLSRVCSNVRIVLSLPRLKDKLESGCSKWIELLGSLRVYTHLPWERKELVNVALYHLKECSFLPVRQSESLAHLLASVHLQLRKRQDTHCSNIAYEYFTERFVHQLSDVHSSIETKCSLISSALACVSTASNRAKTLQDRIQRELVIHTEKKEACLRLLVQIGQDTAILKQHSGLLAKQRDRITHLKKVIPEFEHACDLSLQEKKSIVNASQQLVLNMDQQGLSELRTVQRPPEDVEELLVAVIHIVKGPTADKTWTKGAKRLMANLDRFCELLMEFGAREDGSDTVLEALDPLIDKTTFTPENFSSYTGGQAASQLCTWVQGVHSLHTTLQTKIRPLQSKITTMQASLNEYSDRLKQQENKIHVLDQRLRGLSVALENASVEKSRQSELVNSMQKDCQQTNEFIQALSGVHQDWLTESTDTMAMLTRSIGSCCLSASLAVYLSPLDPHILLEVVNQQIVPVMKERGVELYWEKNDKFLTVFVNTPNEHTHEDDDTESSLAEHIAQQDTQMHSYSSLCSCLVKTMVPDSFSDHWVPVCGSLPQLLSFALIESSWKRWPLVYDPHGLARDWIKCHVGEILISLDGSDRSSKFYLSLEQALVNGHSVLVEHFPCAPADPSLHPLLLLKHNWNEGVNVVQLCGYRLHVHPSFRLYLTTTTPLSAISSSVVDEVNVISSDISFQVAKDLLLETSVDLLGRDNLRDGFKSACDGVASCKSQLGDLDKQLFEQLPLQDKDHSYWLCTGKIESTVTKKNEVLSELESHLDTLHKLFVTKSSLQSLTNHAAMVYSMIKQLSQDIPRYAQSWNAFVKVFRSTLEVCKKKHSNFIAAVEKAEGIQRDNLVIDAIKDFDQILLQDTVRYLDHNCWKTLAVSLALLSQCNPTPASIPLLTDQLEYLKQSTAYIQELDLSYDLPDNPTCISVDLWQVIHKLPLPVEYFSHVVKSTHSNPGFWEKIESEPPCINDFPWKSGDSTCSLFGLEDHVMLRCISKKSSDKTFEGIVSSAVDSVAVPTLSDVLKSRVSEKCPVLLYYDEKSQISQINHSRLEEIIQKLMKDKSVQTIKMGAAMEGLVADLLAQPKSDYVIVEDLHYASQHWLELLSQRTKQAIDTGCLLVFTTSVISSNLPFDFVQNCHTSLLSKLATISSDIIPISTWLTCALNHTHVQLLKLSLASVPENIMSKCNKLSQNAKTLVFNLSVLHTAVALHRPSRSLLPCKFTNLLRSLTKLISIASNGGPNMIDTLTLTVREVYSSCVSSERLDHLLDVCLSVDSCVPGTRLALEEGVEFTSPQNGVVPTNFAEHVQLDTKDGSCQISWSDFSDGIENLLLPLLAQLPQYHSSQSPHISPSTPVSPSHVTPSNATTIAVLTALEYCTENLPTCLDIGEFNGSVEMSVCSQLPSSDDYSNFRIQRLCSQFNSSLSTIRENDIPLITRYSRVEFDGLPLSLTPTLHSLQCGQWPPKWSVQPTTDSVSLAEGVQSMRSLHEQLASFST